LEWIDNKILSQNQKNWSKKEYIDEIINDMDIDGDGSISFEELENW
jgi:Ca2+-binding EF-hand superfamily protein